jgi:hypothetical protein
MMIKLAILALAGMIGYLLFLKFRPAPAPAPKTEGSDAADKALKQLKSLQKEIAVIVDRHRKRVLEKEVSEERRKLRNDVVDKVADVVAKAEGPDRAGYLQSLRIRLEAFRAAYRGEPEFEYTCDVSHCKAYAGELIDEILAFATAERASE